MYDEDKRIVLDNIEKLVIKDVAEAGGYGVVFGDKMTPAERDEWRERIEREPRRFIAQEVIDFLDLDIMDAGKAVPRKADLRAFVLTGEKTTVWASGLTRFSRNPDLRTHGYYLARKTRQSVLAGTLYGTCLYHTEYF